MSKKDKPLRTPTRVMAPSGIFMQLSRDEWLSMHRAAPDDHIHPRRALTISPLELTVVVHWASPEHILCDAAMLYPSHIDVLFEPGSVDEAVHLAEPGALAEFYYACERFNEFDALVIENTHARDHILSLDPPTGILDRDLVTPAQQRVHAVVAAAAARRAVEEISHGC